MLHYTKEELELFRSHKMSVFGRIFCTIHLKMCTACAKLLEELKDDDELVAELRDSVKLYQFFSSKHSIPPHQ